MTQHQRPQSDPQEDAVGRIAWEILAIADIEDHRGEDPIDHCRRDAIRRALEAAYTAGHEAALAAGLVRVELPRVRVSGCRSLTRELARAVDEIEARSADPVYGTIGGGA